MSVWRTDDRPGFHARSRTTRSGCHDSTVRVFVLVSQAEALSPLFAVIGIVRRINQA